jgi:uncharacterized protein
VNSFQAVRKQNRIEVVDALRGLALLGIILANVPFKEQSTGLAKLDSILQMAVHLLIDKKFITIFSTLFGFGFYIQLRRAEEKGIAFRAYYLRRMFILLLIGCLHAYLLWYGDIIRDYAICGMFLLLVYKWPPKKILLTGITFVVFFTGLVFILNGVLGLPDYSYDTSIIREHPVTESYLRYLQINARVDPFVNFTNDSPITFVFCFGNMLIGFWMAKTGFFENYQLFRRARRILMLAGATIGILSSYLFVQITSGKIELTPALLWLPFVIVAGMLLQSLFYISLFVELFTWNKWRRILQPFSPVGKMALTNYLLQTIFYLLVFFHWTHGLNLFGRISPSQTYLLAIGFFFVQVFFSRWWMKSHEQGPVESFWKKLSYRFFSKAMVTGEVERPQGKEKYSIESRTWTGC